ncbi:MAG: tRNA (adenosine(37)-N6)-dimethylallyltransferase MiaA [Solirubrobacterales bacterium]|nr:tRNA (adenosine(37)-N6)-dimethylallyltransferase MiaA [Solirubrobacterales bacterium]MCB8915115.1 tRNA (adenosine(37)-N6)-dimethylallyltransferase MiaA [Thermoleophilales bacterium]
MIAIFGPTGIGKTGVAIELAEKLRERGADPVAINCDSIQVYRGLELISGAATSGDREKLEHRLISFVPITEEFSAGRFGEAARKEIDGALESGRIPILVGGTGLYLRAALSDLEMRPAVDPEIRRAVEAEIEREGPEALHATLPPKLAGQVHSHDRKRIARLTELNRSGINPHPDHEGGGELWTSSLRHPTLLIGLVEDDRVLLSKIRERVGEMAANGAGREAELADQAGASRTVRAAIGFDEFRSGDLERVIARHRRLGRRQMTWMRRLEGIEVIDRSELEDEGVAAKILELAEQVPCRVA